MSATDLSGLMPEDVANVSNINLQSEQLRKQGIGDIFRAMGQTAQAEYYDALAEKTRNPEGAYRQAQTLEYIKKMKTPEEINKLRAEAYQALQSGRLSESRYNEINKLLNGKIEASRLGNELTQRQVDEYLSVMFPTGTEGEFETGAVKATDIADLLAGKYDESALPREKFATAQEQTATEIEQVIRGYKTGSGKVGGPKSSEALARYQDFNRYSNRSRVAINDNGKIKFINLPKIGGKIIAARDVYRAAQAVNMSIEEYVEKVLGISLNEAR